MILLATNNPGTLNSAVATEWTANDGAVHDTTYVQGASLVRDNTAGTPIYFPETNNNVTWIHHVARVDLAGNGEDGHGGPYIFDAAGNQIFYLEGSNGWVSPQFRGPASYNGAYSAYGTGRITFDIMFALNPGAGTGTVRMYVNGIVHYEAIDVPWTRGNPVRIYFRSADMANRWQSELIVSTESTLGCRLVHMLPAADGFHGTAWDPRSAGVMSPTIETFMATPATGAKISHTIPAWAGPVTHPIQEVWVDAYAVASSEEVIPTQLTALLRMGGVDYESAPKPFTNFPSPLHFAFPTNPATGLPWEWADLTGLEYGLNTVA